VVDITWPVLIKTCIIGVTRARLQRLGRWTSNTVAQTLSWALFGSRSVAFPGFRSINARPGFCKWNLSLLGIDGYKLEDMPKGAINGDILQLTKAMMEHYGIPIAKAIKSITYGNSMTSILIDHSCWHGSTRTAVGMIMTSQGGQFEHHPIIKSLTVPSGNCACIRVDMNILKIDSEV
jgi:hypothetical protein